MKFTKNKIQRDTDGKFTAGSGGINLVEKINWRRSAPVIGIIALFGGILLYQAFAGVNRPAYRYTAGECTSGRPTQVNLCKNLSSEALVFRLYKGVTNANPADGPYETWVRKLVTDKTDPIELANILVWTTTNSSNSEYVTQLYARLYKEQNTAAITGWVKQLDAGKQTRAKIALYLAKQNKSVNKLSGDFAAFFAAAPKIDFGTTQPPVDQPDTTPPTVAITAPANNAKVSGAGVNLAANATDNVAVTKVEFKIDTTIVNTDTTAPYAYSWDSTLASNASHTLTVVAYDAAGNTKTASISFTVENAITNNGKKFKIALIGASFSATDGTFETKAAAYRSLLMSHQPFQDLADNIEFIQAKTDSINLGLGCSGGIIPGDPNVAARSVTCDNNLVEQFISSKGIQADRVVVIWNNDKYGGAAEGGGKYAYISIGSDRFVYEGYVFIHEFAHTLGLVDEYPASDALQVTYNRDKYLYLDTLQGQCIVPQTPPPTSWRTTSGLWSIWKDIPDVTWVDGCTATYWYRPSASSIMFEVSQTYNSVSVQVMKNTINSYLR